MIPSIENIIIYIIGYVVTLIVLFKFKKQLHIDSYDGPKGYTNYDDWSSNRQAYTAWSLMWPGVWLVMGFVCIWKGLSAIAKLIEKLTK